MIQNSPTESTPPPIDVSDYRGQWIAIHPQTHEVLGNGEGPEAAMRSMNRTDVEPLLYFVSTSDAFFVGTGL